MGEEGPRPGLRPSPHAAFRRAVSPGVSAPPWGRVRGRAVMTFCAGLDRLVSLWTSASLLVPTSAAVGILVHQALSVFRCPLWAGLKEGREDSGLKGIASVGGEGTSSPSDSRRSSHPASPETRPRRSARVKLPWQGVGAPAGCSRGPRDPDLGAPVRTRGVRRLLLWSCFRFKGRSRVRATEWCLSPPRAEGRGGGTAWPTCFFMLRPQRGCVRRATANQKSLLPEAEPQRPWRAATRRPRDAVPGTRHQTAASQGSGYSSDFVWVL